MLSTIVSTGNQNQTSAHTACSSTMRKLIFTTLLLIPFGLLGQDVQDSDLKLLEGTWAGSLTYTDYGDDKSKVNLPAKLEISEKKGKLKFKYFYTEPNGTEETRSGAMSRGKSADKFEFGSSWKILSFSRKDGGWNMELFTLGKDNNKPSEIRMHIDFAGEELTYIKEVKYNTGTEFFERNRHEFSRD